DTLGQFHPQTAESGMAVARDLLEAGRYRESVDHATTVWGQCREELSEDNRATLNARALLGVGFRCLGESEQAGAHIEAALTGLTRGFGSMGHDTLACRLSRALNLLCAQRTEQARTEIQEVQADYRRLLSEQHPYSLTCEL